MLVTSPLSGQILPYNDNGSTSGAVSINLDDGTHVFNLTGYTDLNVSAGEPGKGARLLVKRDNLGTWDMSTPAGWKWVGVRQTIDPGSAEELEVLLLPLSDGTILASIRSII